MKVDRVFILLIFILVMSSFSYGVPPPPPTPGGFGGEQTTTEKAPPPPDSPGTVTDGLPPNPTTPGTTKKTLPPNPTAPGTKKTLPPPPATPGGLGQDSSATTTSSTSSSSSSSGGSGGGISNYPTRTQAPVEQIEEPLVVQSVPQTRSPQELEFDEFSQDQNDFFSEEQVEKSEDSNIMIFVIGGLLILIFGLIILVFLLHRSSEQPHPELLGYVGQMKNLGYTEDIIKNKLIESGYGVDVVNKVVQ